MSLKIIKGLKKITITGAPNKIQIQSFNWSTPPIYKGEKVKWDLNLDYSLNVQEKIETINEIDDIGLNLNLDYSLNIEEGIPPINEVDDIGLNLNLSYSLSIQEAIAPINEVDDIGLNLNLDYSLTIEEFVAFQQPEITFPTALSDRITYRVKNVDSENVRIYYGIGEEMDPGGSAVFEPNQQSSTISYTNLTGSNSPRVKSYEIHAFATPPSSFIPQSSTNIMKSLVTPTIQSHSKTSNSITVTLRHTNDDNVNLRGTLTIIGEGSRTEINSDAPKNTNRTVTFTGLTSNATYNFWTRSISITDDTFDSPISEQITITTDPPTPQTSTPTVSLIPSGNSITLLIRNGDALSVNLTYPTNTLPSGFNLPSSLGPSSNSTTREYTQTVTDVENGTYSIGVRAQASGKTQSNTVNRSATIDGGGFQPF